MVEISNLVDDESDIMFLILISKKQECLFLLKEI